MFVTDVLQLMYFGGMLVLLSFVSGRPFMGQVHVVMHCSLTLYISFNVSGNTPLQAYL